MCGWPEPFRSVRDLVLVPVGCPGRPGESQSSSSPWLPAWLPVVLDVWHRGTLVLVITAAPVLMRRPHYCPARPSSNPTAAGPLGRRVLSRVGVADHVVTPQPPWTVRLAWILLRRGSGRAPALPPACRACRLCRLVWLAYSASWQPRLPDPSCASPALAVAPKDKRGKPSRGFFPSIVIPLCGGQAPGRGHRSRGTMSPDKIRAAARKRMAETGEPYTAARREVIKNYQEAGAGPEPPRPPARGGSQSTTAAWTGSPCGWTHEGGGPDAGAWRSTRPCCGSGWLISIWTSLAARCDQPPALHFRPGEPSGYTLAEAAGW